MHFQWDWLCLGVLIISSVAADVDGDEALDADVEVEDFDEQSQAADVDRKKSSLEVGLQKTVVEVCFIEISQYCFITLLCVGEKLVDKWQFEKSKLTVSN